MARKSRRKRKFEPCPFCGGTEISLFQTDFGDADGPMYHCVQCDKCGAQVCAGRDEGEEDAVLRWNSRSYRTGSTPALCKALKELLDAMYDMGIDEETVAIAAESKNCCMNSSSLLEVIRNAKAAIAGPQRNCDRFDDSYSAMMEFLFSHKLSELPKDATALEIKYGHWLFAKAKKGGKK